VEVRVLFNTYPMAFHTPGGGEIQLLAYERYLAAQQIQVERFNMWSPDFLAHDIVHYFGCIGGSSHFCAFVKRLGLPLVVSSSLWITRETMADYPAEEIRHQLSLADRIVTNSRRESETLAEVLELTPSKFADVPNGIDPRLLEPADPALFRTAFNISRPFALCVGNIEPRKNQHRLVQAMASQGDLDLVLMGHVRHPEYWQQVQAIAGPNVRYLGAVPNSSPLLAAAYAACAVFVLPSLLETPGLAALEAAAQNAPLAVTEVGCTREYFGEEASYLDPLSVASIGLAVTRARQAGPGTFVPPTWPEAVMRLAATYGDLLNRAT